MTMVETRLGAPSVKQQVVKVNMGGYLADWAPQMNEAIAEFDTMPHGTQRNVYKQILRQLAGERDRFGLTTNPTKLGVLQRPGEKDQSNLKIGKNLLPTWSLTLQSAGQCKVWSASMDALVNLNTCQWAGLCGPLCVLSHGRGTFSTVQAARNWRTWVLWMYPIEFGLALRHEILSASRWDGEFLARFNVNSDLPWYMVDALFDGVDMKAYDYTKRPGVLDGDGWVLPNYRQVFSWSERSVAADVAAFLARGGSVAMVTNRHRTQAVVESLTIGGVEYPTVDGDKDDDRYSTPGGHVVDLFAKGKAYKRKSKFVASVYSHRLTAPH